MNVLAKGLLLARRLGDPSNGPNDLPLEKITGTLQFNTTQLSALCFYVTRTTSDPVYGHGASKSVHKLSQLTTAKILLPIYQARLHANVFLL